MKKAWFNQISQQLDLPPERVMEIYKSYWKYIRDYIQELPLKEELTEEQFNTLKVNINIPLLGKFNCNYARILKQKSSFNKHRTNKQNDKIKKD